VTSLDPGIWLHLIARCKPANWTQPSILAVPVAITAAAIAKAELPVLEHHAVEVPSHLDA
jgi:hypothetical protein